MIRTVLLLLYVFGFCAYAYRNWYLSLCALIILNTINEHPDMPRAMFGIPGLSPWNILLLNVVMGWIVQRGREKARFDPPPALALFGAGYLVIMFVAWLRMFNDRTGIANVTSMDLINDLLINSIKWVVPGILLFDGARTKERMTLAVGTVCGIYMLFALQVLHWMPPWAILDGDALQRRAIKLIEKEMGYSRVNMSMMLAGGSWALLCAREMFTSSRIRWLAFIFFVVIGFAQAMTGGRMGYVTWGLIGILLSLVRWRRYLVIGPAFLMILVAFVPAVRERALTGVEDSEITGDETQVNTAEMTSDRTLIWPTVIEKIKTGPIVGFGMAAMQRTGLSDEFKSLAFPHPHNAYLEVLLDSGIVGFIPVVGFFLTALFSSGKLFLIPRSNLERAVGGMAFSLVLAMLIASFGSQHFLPQEGGVGMWAAIGLSARLTVDRRRARVRARRPVQRPQPAIQQPARPRVAAR